ncbi:MAG: hypothetical protein H7Y03_08720 [Chitinophagaceae bacterium]|nr:hypothetical protein [Chitinophagaceae bacterium]
MKANFLPSTILVIIAIALAGAGCEKGDCKQKHTIYVPVYKSLSEIRKSIKSEGPRRMEETGKIYLKGKYILINEPNKGIHVIDNSQPRFPRKVSFIAIPGNVDMAVKDNILYADSYSDLVTIDISNPQRTGSPKFLDDVFPYYRYQWSNSTNPDSIQILVDYTERDTIISCQDTISIDIATPDNMESFKNLSSSSVSVGGSMARYTVVNDYLYTVTNSNLKVFDIADASAPSYKRTISLGWGIETLYPFKDKLFIGSTTGMFVYDITEPGWPKQLSRFSHARSCDPVVADDNYAYVTLRSGSFCAGTSNQLDVLDVADVKAPFLKQQYEMKNPHGLSKDGELLFICDGTDGLKVYQTKNGYTLTLLQHIKGLETFDVITWNNTAFVIAKDGLHQYDYSNPENIKKISKISLN